MTESDIMSFLKMYEMALAVLEGGDLEIQSPLISNQVLDSPLSPDISNEHFESSNVCNEGLDSPLSPDITDAQPLSPLPTMTDTDIIKSELWTFVMNLRMSVRKFT